MTNHDTMHPRRAWLWWSSGKDCAWALHVLRQRADIEVSALVTTCTREYGRIAMHGVRRELVRRQARALGLPVHEMQIPAHCANEDYERGFADILGRARAAGVEAMVFGDIFLADVRAYRERLFRGSGIQPVFPLWRQSTAALASRMVSAGLSGVVVCLDPAQLDTAFAGRAFDRQFLDDLPARVDPCGENGEFHTLVNAGPVFKYPLAVQTGETVRREGFIFTDVRPRE